MSGFLYLRSQIMQIIVLFSNWKVHYCYMISARATFVLRTIERTCYLIYRILQMLSCLLHIRSDLDWPLTSLYSTMKFWIHLIVPAVLQNRLVNFQSSYCTLCNDRYRVWSLPLRYLFACSGKKYRNWNSRIVAWVVNFHVDWESQSWMLCFYKAYVTVTSHKLT